MLDALTKMIWLNIVKMEIEKQKTDDDIIDVFLAKLVSDSKQLRNIIISNVKLT